jgi:hypothetical protein
MYIIFTLPDSSQLSSKKRPSRQMLLIIETLPYEPGHDTAKFTDIAHS